MLIAVLSDIHDHTTNMLVALNRAREEGCSHLFCLGDVVESATFRLLCEEWPYSADIIYGNNEWETGAFTRIASLYPHVTHLGSIGRIDRGGRHLFLNHTPFPAVQAARSGDYDAVFCGHTHVPRIEWIGSTLFVNPGEILGRRGAPSIALYDTELNDARHILI